jgi:hypothetical protein
MVVVRMVGGTFGRSAVWLGLSIYCLMHRIVSWWVGWLVNGSIGFWFGYLVECLVHRIVGQLVGP